MKTKLLILFLFLSVFGFGQTKLDTLLFNKINEYRKSKHLKVFIWDTNAYKASKHHTEYLFDKQWYSGKRFIEAAKAAPLNSKEEKIYLKSTVPYPHFEEENSVFYSCSDRYEYFSKKKHINSAEVIAGVMECFHDSVNSKYEKLAILTLNAWKGSPEHNAILIDPKYTKGCGSNSIEIVEQGIKNRKCYYVTSTFLVLIINQQVHWFSNLH